MSINKEFIKKEINEIMDILTKAIFIGLKQGLNNELAITLDDYTKYKNQIEQIIEQIIKKYEIEIIIKKYSNIN